MRLACTAPAALVLCLAPSFAQDVLLGWRATQNATAVTLIGVEQKIDGTTVFSFQNASPETVTAFSITTYRDAHIQVTRGSDCFDNDAGCWQPGAIAKIEDSTEGLKATPDRTIIIGAALFADGTSDGSPAEVNPIIFERLGRMFETERLRGIFAAPLARHTGSEGAERLAREIGVPPRSPDEAFESVGGVKLPGVSLQHLRLGDKRSVHAFLSGVRRERQVAISKLLESPIAGSMEDVLVRAQQEYTARSLKHRAFCESTHGGGLK